MNRCVLQKFCRLRSIPLQPVRYMSRTHYEVLGLRSNASQEDIKSAYKQMCKKLHPDVNREDPKTHEKFIRLKDAYSIIGNVATRREYDRELAVRLQYHAQNIRHSGYDAMYKQEGGFKGDPFYTYPKYDEEIFNRRHYPNEYCKDYDRSKNGMKSWSWIHIVLVGIILNITIFTLSGRSLSSQLNARDQRAAKTWRDVQRSRQTLKKDEVELNTKTTKGTPKRIDTSILWEQKDV